MRALCAAMDHPERQFRTVLVAGTNGKGSVAAMTSSALEAAGRRTGRYTSPHLVRLEERFDVGGAPVRADDLDAAIAAVRHAVDRLQAEGVIDVHPTFFEVTTAAAFELFRHARVEVAVLEVGLGGRFDATNVVDPMAVAITSIALDHEAYLGDTLGKIAFEKAGVIRPAIPIVCGPLPAEAMDVVRAVCARAPRAARRGGDRVPHRGRAAGGPDAADARHARGAVRAPEAGAPGPPPGRQRGRGRTAARGHRRVRRSRCPKARSGRG